MLKSMIYNVFKPKNWTSFDVVAKMRGILHTRKIGHSGTLDPLAEGVLVVLTEKDTKKQNEFMALEKEYRAKVAFGVISPTYDLEGPLEFTGEVPGQREIETKLLSFTGEINQTVPPFSAVRVNGKRLYKEARKGNINENELPVKKVKIYGIQIESFGNETININGELKSLSVVSFTVQCSSGTYIRSLAHDIGGVLVSLLRTRIGTYRIEDSKTLDALAQPLPSQS